MTNTTYKIAIALKNREADYNSGRLEPEFSWDEFSTAEEAKQSLIEWLRDIDHGTEIDGEYIGNVIPEDGGSVCEVSESEALEGTGMHLYAAIESGLGLAVAVARAIDEAEAAEQLARRFNKNDETCTYEVDEDDNVVQYHDGAWMGMYFMEEI